MLNAKVVKASGNRVKNETETVSFKLQGAERWPGLITSKDIAFRIIE